MTERYSFVHESFAEFFVASYLYGLLVKGDVECLKERLHNPQVLAFLSQHPDTDDVVATVGTALSGKKSHPNLIVNALVLLSSWFESVRDLKLRSLFLLNARINRLRFRRATLYDSQFEEVQLTDGAWHNCFLNNVRYCKCDVNQFNFNTAHFTNLTIDHGRFVKCSFIDATFTRGKLSTVFTNCTFQNCKFIGCVIESCLFESCTFDDSTFFEATLSGVSFHNVTFKSKMVWSHHPMTNLTFFQTSFQDSGRPLLEALKRGVDATKPIKMQKCSGLDLSIIKNLQGKGVEFAG